MLSQKIRCFAIHKDCKSPPTRYIAHIKALLIPFTVKMSIPLIKRLWNAGAYRYSKVRAGSCRKSFLSYKSVRQIALIALGFLSPVSHQCSGRLVQQYTVLQRIRWHAWQWNIYLQLLAERAAWEISEKEEFELAVINPTFVLGNLLKTRFETGHCCGWQIHLLWKGGLQCISYRIVRRPHAAESDSSKQRFLALDPQQGCH